MTTTNPSSTSASAGRKMFVNLPVKDLAKSIAFFKAIGFSFNPQFTDETAACMIVSSENYVMLLTEPKMQEFTPLPITDPKKSTGVLVCLSCDQREEVAQIVSKALAAGGTRVGEPRDFGMMIQESFQDLDGTVWEFIWMDPTKLPPS